MLSMRDARQAPWRALALAVLLMAGLAAQAADQVPVQPSVLPLQAWDFERDGIAFLDGAWDFAPGRLIEPGQAWPADATTAAVPGSWNAVLGARRGAGTYRVKVACHGAQPLALALPFQHSAARVFVNGRLLAQQGAPGMAREAHQPSMRQQTVDLPPGACPLELLVQVSNFEMFRGGMLRSVQLGERQQLLQRREAALLRTQVALGALLFLGLFSLMFFSWRPRDRAPLFFSLFTFCCAVSLGLSGERPLQPLVAGLGFDAQMRLLFFSWFMGLGTFPWVLRRLYPRESSDTVVRGISCFAAAGMALTALTPVHVFAYSAPALMAGACGVALYLAAVLGLAIRGSQRGAGVLLAGLVVLVAAAVHDVVFLQHLLASSLLPYGVLGFVLAPAVVLARRFAQALTMEELLAERMRHELEMSNRAKFIDDLFDSVPLGLALRDPDGRYLVVNRTWERYIGLGRESVIGTSLGDVNDPAAQSALALDREALALGPDAALPAREYDYNGRRYMQTRTVMVDSEGRRIGVLAASLDITDKYATEQALAVERERLRLLVRSTKAGFGDWDAVRDRVTYTGRFKEMLGYPADADTSTWPSIFEMMHPEDRERARDQFRAMIRRKSQAGEQEPGAPMSYRLRRTDGSYIWIHAEGIAQVDEEGRTRRFITSYLDVTTFHEQAALLERQNEALKENVRLREEVERIGRHDIKTPLNSIVAVPRLLREERRLGPEADELLGIVERAGYRILSMVNLSLDLHKMEQGSYTLRPDAVDLVDLMDKVSADVRIHAASKGVRLKVDVGAAPYAWAEELLCYSMLANLLKNAVEASPEDGVVSVAAHAAADGAVELRIHNRGVVPESIRSHFFQKYATLGKASGTGLGTYSARLMARVQDGDIRLETSEEEGTTLVIRLRAAPAGAQPATARHAAARQGVEPLRVAALPPMRVLLVDDDEYNLLIVRRFLPTPPFTVDTAINGRVALAAAELHWPDVIFMDLDMPVMGGLQAVRELRELERAAPVKRCTIVALSSHDDEETRSRSLAAGFDSYLAKPVTRDAIHEILLGVTPPLGADDPVVLDADIEPILQDFIQSRRGLIAGMEHAMGKGDRGEVRRLAHQLAGSFDLYGFHWAGHQSRAIEREFSRIGAEQLNALAARMTEHLDNVEIRFSDA